MSKIEYINKNVINKNDLAFEGKIIKSDQQISKEHKFCIPISYEIQYVKDFFIVDKRKLTTFTNIIKSYTIVCGDVKIDKNIVIRNKKLGVMALYDNELILDGYNQFYITVKFYEDYDSTDTVIYYTEITRSWDWNSRNKSI